MVKANKLGWECNQTVRIILELYKEGAYITIIINKRRLLSYTYFVNPQSLYDFGALLCLVPSNTWTIWDRHQMADNSQTF